MDWTQLTVDEWIWLGIGGGAQCLFAGRILVQWWVSEKHQQSIVPASFWWLSVCGALMMLAYAARRRDPIIAIGQITGLAAYTRNLILLYRRQNSLTETADEPITSLAIASTTSATPPPLADQPLPAQFESPAALPRQAA